MWNQGHRAIERGWTSPGGGSMGGLSWGQVLYVTISHQNCRVRNYRVLSTPGCPVRWEECPPASG